MQDYFERLAQIESSGDPFAQNPNSSAKGLFQFIDSTGKQFGLDQYEFGTPEYTQAEIEAVREFTDQNSAVLSNALGREPTQGELYLAHQQGAGGALKLLQDPNARAVDVVGGKAITLNAGTPDMTAQEFASKWTGKFDDGQQGQDVLLGQQGQDKIAKTFSVQLPNGQVVDGIPQGTTKEQIKEKLLASGFDGSAFEAPIEDVAPQQADQGFLEEVVGDLGVRGSNIGQGLGYLVGAGEKDFDPIRGGIITGGQVIGAGADVLGNIIGRGVSAVTPDAVKSSVGSAVNAIGSADLPFTDETIGSTLGNIGESYSQFKEENPENALLLESAGNIASVFAPVKNIGGGARLKSVGSKIKEQSNRISPRVNALTSDDLAKESAQAYKNARDIGATLPDDFVNNWVGSVASDVMPKGALAKSVATKKPEVENFLEGLTTQLGSRPSLDDFDEVDKMLSQLKRDNLDPATKELNATGRDYAIIQEKLRDQIDSIDESKVGGGKEGFQALSTARQLWSRKIRMRDIEDIIYRASLRPDPTHATKSYLGTYLNQIKKGKVRGFSDIEIKAMEKIAKHGKGTELMGLFKSFLPSAIAFSANPVAGVGMRLGSQAIRQGVDANTSRHLGSLGQLVSRGGDAAPRAIDASAIDALGGLTRSVGQGLDNLGKYKGKQMSVLGLINQAAEQEQQQPRR